MILFVWGAHVKTDTGISPGFRKAAWDGVWGLDWLFPLLASYSNTKSNQLNHIDNHTLCFDILFLVP
jgi:hypothetical protein